MLSDAFRERLDSNQLQIVEYLHDCFLNFPEITSKIRYRIPFYDYKSWICYINPLKKGGVELCFIKGQELSAYPEYLHSKGRKMIAGIEIKTIEKAAEERVMECFTEALFLDEHK